MNGPNFGSKKIDYAVYLYELLNSKVYWQVSGEFSGLTDKSN